LKRMMVVGSAHCSIVDLSSSAMEMLGYSSLVEEGSYDNSDVIEGDMSTWLESLEDFNEPENDYFKIDDYPHKRRKRRQRLHSLHCYVARSGVEAVAASAMMLTRQVENMARGEGKYQYEDADGSNGISTTFSAHLVTVKSRLLHAVGTAAASVGDVAADLTTQLGEPPQRILDRTREEQDAPLLLFWAINVCALCTLASLFYFAFAFCAYPSSMQGAEQAQSTSSGKRCEGLVRVMGVVILSLASGCGLGLRHPIQSALLCGL